MRKSLDPKRMEFRDLKYNIIQLDPAGIGAPKHLVKVISGRLETGELLENHKLNMFEPYNDNSLAMHSLLAAKARKSLALEKLVEDNFPVIMSDEPGDDGTVTVGISGTNKAEFKIPLEMSKGEVRVVVKKTGVGEYNLEIKNAEGAQLISHDYQLDLNVVCLVPAIRNSMLISAVKIISVVLALTPRTLGKSINKVESLIEKSIADVVGYPQEHQLSNLIQAIQELDGNLDRDDVAQKLVNIAERAFCILCDFAYNHKVSSKKKALKSSSTFGK